MERQDEHNGKSPETIQRRLIRVFAIRADAASVSTSAVPLRFAPGGSLPWHMPTLQVRDATVVHAAEGEGIPLVLFHATTMPTGR